MARKCWYAYNGPVGSTTLISNFTLLPMYPLNCPNGPNICAIYMLCGGDGHPISISSNLLNYIATAKVDFVDQPRTGPKMVLMKL